MPYKVKGQCVFRKDTNKKVGCTKGDVNKYLAALHANVDESKELTENENGKIFYGYHATKHDFKNGLYKGQIDITYPEAIRETYQNIISEYDKNIENDDIGKMGKILENKGYGFTFVSSEPIKASSFQSGQYKYGEYLYKVYGKGNELILDDYNEINAEIVVSKHPLYFEKIENMNESNKLKGGKADKLTPEDIAKKFKVTTSKIQAQIRKGIKVEMEHTKDREKAREIATDHVSEFADYYDRIKKMEDKASNYWKAKDVTENTKSLIKRLIRENLTK
jgi:hypothetical protein